MALDPKSMPTVVNRFGSTVLFDDISETDTEIRVSDGSGLPFDQDGGCIQIGEEIIVFEYRVGDTLFNARRGQDGTTASAHSRGVVIRSQIVALNFNSIKDSVLQLEQDIGNAAKQEVITITADMVADKFLMLQDTPSSTSSVQIFPQGGPMQIQGIDYSVIDNLIVWNFLGLDGFLEEGDKLIIYYNS